MTFPTRRRDWKRVRPGNLREAFRLCKDHARERRNLSVERIADLMGISADLLYKWLSNGEMRACLIPLFESVCGLHLVTEHLAAFGSRLVIDIPTGAKPARPDFNALQLSFSQAIALLVQFYEGHADQAETQAALTGILSGLAWHRENVERFRQPELEFGEGGQ